MDKQLSMRNYTVRVAIVPTTLDVQLFGAKLRYETRVISGYTLKDAKKRAGIQ
jgi:hypothetical protein